MDPTRFDTLTRYLSTTGSRRRALSGLLAGTLGVLGWHDGDEIAAHDLKDKCKKKSGEAKKKCLKKAKQHAATHTSPPPPVTPPPPPPPETCASHRDCPEYHVCTNEECSSCHGESCATNDDCCTRVCIHLTSKSYCSCHLGNSYYGEGADTICRDDRKCCNHACDSITGKCSCDPDGALCYNEFQCCGSCVMTQDGFRCQTGVCPPTADYCANGAPTCGAGGFCLRPFDGGPARCGRHDASTNGSMCNCVSHADCMLRTGHSGAFCAQVTGGNCLCPRPNQPNGTTFCATPR